MASKALVELTDEQRLPVFSDLTAASINSNLPRGTYAKLAEKYGVSTVTIRRIWYKRHNVTSTEEVLQSIKKKREDNCGKKPIPDEIISDALKNTTLRQRKTIRHAAASIGCSVRTLVNAMKHGVVKKESSSLKPSLTPKNKIKRTNWCLSFADKRSMEFSKMYNYVHRDEKWFYMKEATSRCYMAKDEASPHREGKSKRFIQKVMFLAAVARPRYDEEGDLIFHGKLGIWPFIQLIPAKRSSKNRPKRTLVLKPRSVDKETYKEFLLSKAFPSIFEEWPGSRPGKILLRHDNAPAHVPGDDPDIVSASNCGRTSIDLVPQPPNSPDLNILGLGLFNGTSPSTIEELVTELNKAYEQYEPRSIDNCFLTLNKGMECIMKEHGANTYKMPHMKKSYHRNNGTPIENVVCDESVFNSAMDALESVE